MFQVAVACALLLLVCWFIQLLPTVFFCLQLQRARRTVAAGAAGKFCVGMPLRGADPDLKVGISRILKQDYPNFELQIIIDSIRDPVWEIAHAAVRELGATNVKIFPLQDKSGKCSLACASLAQFLEGLDDSCEFVAFADGDMIVPPDWLTLMAAALGDKSVGATLGNKWFFPVGGRWGTLVRYLWNAGAVVPMWLFEMPWTGGLAMRRETIQKIQLAQKLRRGFAGDAPVKRAVESLGLRFRFIPQLMIPNWEEIDVVPCFSFIQRQLLNVKLYEPHWWMIVVHAAVTTGIMVIPFISAAALLLMGQWRGAAALGLMGIAYLSGLLFLLALLDRAMRRVIRQAGTTLPPFSLHSAWRLFVAIPLTQLLHLAAVLSCFGKRELVWRGVRYQIDGPWNVQIIDESTTPTTPQGSQDKVSLT
jgi:glycosyltransferase involved in cell wall biosynthesis